MAAKKAAPVTVIADPVDMDYNTCAAAFLLFAEYGRNIQKMIKHACELCIKR